MSAAAVTVRNEEIVFPTYMPGLPDRNPMFLEKRVYQGSSGKVYPLPFTDRVASEPVNCRTVGTAEKCFPPADPLVWHTTAHQLVENPSASQRWKSFYENPQSSGVFFIWGHSWEFSRTAGWDALSRIFEPMSGHTDVWYCTNIELFDAFK
jgi:hypothetical protein